MTERLPKGFTTGSPPLVGHYDCILEDGTEQVIKHHPWFDSEIHPYGELLEQEIEAWKKIPGMKYTEP